MYERIAAKLAGGETIILDGGTGTDIQRRGAPMDNDTWCAEVNLTHPDIVEAVHRDYIAAGADVITANTFATSPLMFNALGRDQDMLTIDQAAVANAKRAAQGTSVAVAGSVSTMRPLVPGSDRNNLAREWPEDEARRLFRRKCEGMAEWGADFIMLEMLRDGDYALWAMEAALATGLPVWAGLSAERGKNDRLQGWGRDDWPFEDIAKKLAATNPDVVCVMHTSPNDTAEALGIVRKYWDGPLGTYPESGYFQMPDWQFVDIIAPDDLADLSRSWQAQGVTIFGGCCGLGPDHIAALVRAFKS
jgi:homocysteine S-methyltransferase